MMNNADLNDLSDLVLATIRRRPSQSFSTERLAKKSNCNKSDITRAVNLLRQTGYKIKRDRQGEITFSSAPDMLLVAEITHRLKTSFIGQTVQAFKSVQSTNTIATQLAAANTPEGTIVVAESQTKGSYLSILIYPNIDPVMAPGLSIVTALSLAETIKKYNAPDIAIKWPNDCLIKGRKVAGILTELSADVGRTNYVIVGVGININHSRSDFPKQISKTATSLRAEIRKRIHRVEFLQKFLTRFEKDYCAFQKAGLKPLRKRIIGYSNLIGKTVQLDAKKRIITGTAVDIDVNGNLVLETPEGLRSFNAGQVTIVKDRKKYRN
jgi:BirA family biotin operon repressor/biotin-[acetyl-CoA-carboxylase] ligase